MTIKRASLWLLTLLCACAGGTETGNPPGVAEVGLSLYTSDPAVASTDPGDDGAYVEHAWLALGEVTLLPCTAGEPEMSLLQAPLAVDLAAEGTPPPPLAVEVGTGFCGLRVGLEMAPGAPEPLAANTVLLSGLRADGVPFQLASAAAPSVELQVGAEHTLDDAGVLLLGVDLASWLTTVNLATAELGTDGSIVIDHATNTTLLGSFDNHLGNALSLHADKDADGVVDIDEQTPLAP